MGKRLIFTADSETLRELTVISRAWNRLGYPKVPRAALIRFAISTLAQDFLRDFPDLRVAREPDKDQLPLFTET